MKTQVVTGRASGTGEAAAKKVIADIVSEMDPVSAALVMVFASTQQPLDVCLPEMVRAFPNATVLGSSTAGEFTEGGDAKGSLAAVAIAGDFRVFAGMATGLGRDPERAVVHATAELPESVDGYPHRTGLLLLDPLAGQSEEATLLVASILGQDVSLAGGAAGDDLKMERTEVGLGRTAASDALVVGLIFSKVPLGLGVCHAHQPISPPLRVTSAQGNVVHTLDGKPAWEVWLEHSEQLARAAGMDPSGGPSAEGAYLLRYEAGLATGAEYKIRAPLARGEEGAIQFACGLPEGAMIRITESTPERQIQSARTAAKQAREQLGAEVAGAIVFDCICRNLILGDTFGQAVAGIAEELGDVPLAGFETYGEIALAAGDMSGFHNTTTVVLAFPK